MTNSITQNKFIKTTAAILFWIAVWQITAMLVGEELFLASPISVINTLFNLLPNPDFWQSLAFSFLRIGLDFVAAFGFGIVFAVLANKNPLIELILSVPMRVIKATPVVSFIILCLIWIGSENLSILISAIMVLPIFYTNVLAGIRNTDKELLEMAKVFRVPAKSQFAHIYLTSIKPYLMSATVIGAGLCWKSGVAAELIGIPTGSIGEQLYLSKIYFDTSTLLAWTIMIILMSMLLEKIATSLIKLFYRLIEKSI